MFKIPKPEYTAELKLAPVFVAAILRSATTRRFSSCRIGSRISMGGKWRLETAPLAGEIQREAQYDYRDA